ncbi:hypothetical protein JRQ81_011617 [Phrynocephalus forsythii]|uniref:Phospholipase A2 inhibitor and Ly6/PLAUR domain-containing protein-like n=1 Tax=Phrynocephalus forsythii TaxID=171643 RepID=A0A9Q1AQC3_9SAUR|nr:hypothetical protein JRQ81_011617 [Phrynocephalus forsythii]
MTASLEFLLFSVFLATGASLDCETCFSLADTCTGSKKACVADQDTCAIISNEIKTGGIAVPTAMKGCQSSRICEIISPAYAIFGQDKFFRSAGLCCTGNACDFKSPKLPEISRTTNGRKCPACYCLTKDGCDCTQLIDCTGSEEYCFALVEEVETGETTITIHVKGCATQSFCTGVRNVSNVESTGLLFVKPECKKAGDASKLPTLHLLSLSGILLTKVLLY